MGYIISYSGTHGTGKTTSAATRFRELKIQYPQKAIRVMHDLEADSPYPINKGGDQYTQEWLFANQIRQELDNLSRFDILVTDRTIVDIIGYTYALGYHSLASSMLLYAGSHMYVYRTIYFKQMANNRFCFNDGIREAKDMAFRRQVEEFIRIQYDQLIAAEYFAGELRYV
jgi:hypothetical protein